MIEQNTTIVDCNTVITTDSKFKQMPLSKGSQLSGK